MNRFSLKGLVCAAVLAVGCSLVPAQAPQDPVLSAMKAELDRSLGKLKLTGAPEPYYIEYRVLDRDAYNVSASFGALTGEDRLRTRMITVTVRVGSYKRDNSFGQGANIVDLLPYENDVYALRHAIWLATDRAYKQAVSAYAMKQSLLKRYQAEQQVDDFSHEPPVTHIGGLAKIDLGSEDWPKVLTSLSGMYRDDLQLASFTANLKFSVTNEYFANTEGSVLRKGRASYGIEVDGTTQASDGTHLQRTYGEITPTLSEFPKPPKLESETRKVLESLKQLRAAPAISEQYEGPVLILNKAADTLIADVVAKNIVGLPPEPGSTARTSGAYAQSYKARILPAFVNIVDDPTLSAFKGEGLLSNYDYDDEAVKAQKIDVVDKGELVNYLTNRQPIRDFTESNGHGRALFTMYGGAATPTPSTLVVSSAQVKPFAELKQKLIELCKDQGLPYAYYVEEMASPAPSPLSLDQSEAPDGTFVPQLLYRIYADGHEELVRGGEVANLDTRALRSNLMMLGDDQFLEGAGGEDAPVGIIAPSMLFGDLVVRPSESGKDKLPQYPPPSLVAKTIH